MNKPYSPKSHSPRLEAFLALVFLIAIGGVAYSTYHKVKSAPESYSAFARETVCFQFPKGSNE